MAYNAMVLMGRSQSLRDRITAAAAEAGIANPDNWVSVNLWKVVATEGWDAKWQYAVDNLTVNANPDLGVRDDVISDSDVQAAVAAANT